MMGRPITAGATLVAALAVCALVPGCAVLRGAATGSAFVDARALTLRLPTRDAGRARGVVYRSPGGEIEYQRKRSPGRGEALLLRARGADRSLAINARQLGSLTRQWRFISSAERFAWRQDHRQSVAGAAIDYRLFERAAASSDRPRQCAAYIKTWDHTATDPLTRPTKAYFGYYCAPPGQALTASAAAAKLQRVRVGSSPIHGFRLGQAVPSDAGAAAWARGQPGGRWGLASFPPNRIRRFPIGGGNGAHS